MADKKIIDLPVLSDVQVSDDNKLMFFGVTGTGALSSGTIAQLKKAFSTQKKLYSGTGSEGVSLTIAALAGKFILLIAREGSIIHEVGSGPSSSEYSWDSTTITFGIPINPSEHILILYKDV